MYPYFRFSKWSLTKELTLLENWFEWFKGLGIPVCITKKPNVLDFPYALWRAGDEAYNEYASDDCISPNSEPLTGEIIMQANGFEMYLQEVVK